MSENLTFRAQTLCPLINQRLSPSSNNFHDAHHVLALGSEARDGLAVDDGFVRGRIDDTGVDCWAMAAVRAWVNVGMITE